MRWRGRRQSDNIVDRRGGGGLGGGFGRGRIPTGLGGGGPRRTGGLGIGTIIIVLAVMYFTGINPLELVGGVDGGGQRIETGTEGEAPSDEHGQFVATVLADTEDTWNEVFRTGGATYEEPRLVLFSGATQSACGYAGAASGPFYCPSDRQVYIDLAFYEELRRRFNAPGDFAEAYVIAHEVGHHVQNLMGTLGEVNSRRAQLGEAESNALSVRVELQADCYAGVWAKDAETKGVLEVGDIDEALNAASQIGDDSIQRRMQGYVVPETFNHGTSEQRQQWFRRGYETGNIDACDTFGAAQL